MTQISRFMEREEITLSSEVVIIHSEEYKRKLIHLRKCAEISESYKITCGKFKKCLNISIEHSKENIGIGMI